MNGYDHHCPWIGKCVGRDNIHDFYLFLLAFGVMLMAYVIDVVMIIWLLKMAEFFVLIRWSVQFKTQLRGYPPSKSISETLLGIALSSTIRRMWGRKGYLLWCSMISSIKFLKNLLMLRNGARQSCLNSASTKTTYFLPNAFINSFKWWKDTPAASPSNSYVWYAID